MGVGKFNPVGSFTVASVSERWQATGVGPVAKEKMKARVFVTLKPSVFDPQGQTIADALHSMGYGGVGDVRQGKYFELELSAKSAEQARALASEVADKLLA